MPIDVIVSRKLLLRLGPLIFLLYLFFAVDRGNIGFAGLQMTKALGLTAEAFGIGSALFTAGYLLFQIPSTAMLRRLGGGRAFAAVACAWGIVSTLTAFASTPGLFFVNRFLLGVAEAGFNIFVIFYINKTFPRRIRGFTVGLTLIAVPASMILASPLSGWLLNLQGYGLSGWQWLFIAEGVPSILIGILCWHLIPEAPNALGFLNGAEKQWLASDLAAQNAVVDRGVAQGTFDALKNPVVWGLGFILFTSIFAINVMLIWMPQIIRQISHADNVTVGMLNSIPWVALAVGLVAMSRIADRLQRFTAVLVTAFALAALGFLFAAAFQNTHPNWAFAGFFLGAFGVGAAQGLFWALTMELLPGAASAYAVVGVLGNASGLFAHPLIGKLRDVAGSFAGVAWALALFSAAAMVAAILTAQTSQRRTIKPGGLSALARTGS